VIGIKGPVVGQRRIVMERRATDCVHGTDLREHCEECRLTLNPPMRERIEIKGTRKPVTKRKRKAK